jgi:uncharacterized protein YbjT (DUF2867 family)
MTVKVIVTGATGMVGEGVLFACLEHPEVEKVLLLSRSHYAVEHANSAKVEEVLVPDFLDLSAVEAQLDGYDACFYCAGVSSRGMSEADYSRITYDAATHVGSVLLARNPQMVFSNVSGSHTDGSEKGTIMWARVKGRAENALLRMAFRKVYNFRPGFMNPTAGQKNIKGYYKVIAALYPVLRWIAPGQTSTMREVGLAMINSVLKGYAKPILEISDIKALAHARPSSHAARGCDLGSTA